MELKRLVDAAGGGRDLRNTVYTVITHEVGRGDVGLNDGTVNIFARALLAHIVANFSMEFFIEPWVWSVFIKPSAWIVPCPTSPPAIPYFCGGLPWSMRPGGLPC